MARRTRGLALLAVIVALGVLQALLAMLWLWSRAESRDAAESQAAARAEWAAAGAVSDALAWVAAQDSLPSDTVLALASAAGVASQATLRRLAPELVELRTETRLGAPGVPLVRRVHCQWLVPSAADSIGTRPLAPLLAEGATVCW